MAGRLSHRPFMGCGAGAGVCACYALKRAFVMVAALLPRLVGVGARVVVVVLSMKAAAAASEEETAVFVRECMLHQF